MTGQLKLFGQPNSSEEKIEEAPIPTELDQLVDLQEEAELEEVPAYIKLLKGAMPSDDTVLQDYVEITGPRIQKEYTLRSAKGSSIEKVCTQ